MLIALKRIAADEFGKAVGLVRVRGAHGAHFAERDINTAFGNLPGRFGAGESSSEDLDAWLQVSVCNGAP